MYLHIGKNYILNDKYILGIFDIENTTVSAYTKKFLRISEEKKEVINVAEDLPKSFIIYMEKGKKTVFITQFNTSSFLNRINNNEGK